MPASVAEPVYRFVLMEITNFCRREWKPEETVISVLNAYKTVRKKPFSSPRTKVFRYFAMARRIPTHTIATNTFH